MVRAAFDLATIAATIARFEPVSMLVRTDEIDLAHELIAAPIDDLWIPDTGPVFVEGAGGWGGVDFNFNGWGGKQEHRRDGKVAEFVAARAGFETVHTDLVLEGGDTESDGAAKATLERLFPGRHIVQINIDAIAAGGGGIHCTTQQEPAR